MFRLKAEVPRWDPAGPVLIVLGLFPALLLGCNSGAEEGGNQGAEAGQVDGSISLGPADGRELSPTDLDRVAVGTVAPDFSLLSLSEDTVTLSSFRGSKNVVLVFYRGHW